VTVGRAELEASLRHLAAGVRDPHAGIYGPESLAWQVNRDVVLLLGGGCAALLQLAHPFVAEAVREHSRTRQDVQGRFLRTFANVFAMVFGDLEHALAAARRVHSVHERVTGVLAQGGGRFRAGTRYAANDPGALLWVHATLARTALDVHERVVGRLTASDRELYWEESKRFAALFGLDDAHVPRTWVDFERYFDTAVREQVEVGTAARETAEFLMTPATRVHAPLAEWYRVMTAGLLPDLLRAQYGLRFGRRERLVFDASIRALALGQSRVPRRLRFFPAYLEAERRMRGVDGRDRVARTLQRFVIRSSLGNPLEALVGRRAAPAR